ncbi:MAG: hypothetical protein ACTS10_04695 [Kiloniellales bacterium]
MRTILLFSFGLLLTACASYEQHVVTPSASTIPEFDRVIPGRHALYIDDAALNRSDRPWFWCHVYNSFIMDARPSFRESTQKTFENLVEDSILVSNPISADNLAEQGFDRQIIVTVEEIAVHAEAVPGTFQTMFLDEELIIEVDLAAVVQIYGSTETLLWRSFRSSEELTGKTNRERDLCGNVKNVFAEAISRSIGKLLNNVTSELAKYE